MVDRMNYGGTAEQKRGPESPGVLGTVSDAARSAVSSVTSAAEQAWETTSQGAQQAASAVTHTAEDAWSSALSCMSRYPIASFLAGVGVGAMIVLALQKRES